MFKFKTILSVLFVLSLMAISILTACQTAPTTPTTPATPAPPATPAKTWTISVGSPAPQGPPQSTALVAYFNEVEKMTNGRVKVGQYTWGGALIKTTNTFEGLRDRVVDAAYNSVQYGQAKVPLTNALTPCFIDDFSGMAPVTYQLWNTVPELRDEWMKKWNIYPIAWMNGTEGQFLTNFPINTVDDLKGHKLRALGVNLPAMANCGAIPVAIAYGDTYEALQKGTVDGVTGVPVWALSANKFAEVVKYVTEWRFSGSSAWLGVQLNLDFWNELPPDIQKIMIDAAPATSKADSAATDEQCFAGLDLARKHNANIKVLSLAEAQAIQNKINPPSIWEDGIKAAEAAGYKNTRALMDQAVKLLQDWDAKNPHPTTIERWMTSRGIK